MRKILVVTIFVLCFLELACSSAYDLVIVNNSDSPLEVEYSLNASSNASISMDGLLKPQIAPFESLSYWFKKPVWKNMEIEKYKWNSETKSVRTTLEHGESLKIGMLFEGQRGFPVKSLRLKGASGEDNYSGESISRQFREYQGAYYVHIYK